MQEYTLMDKSLYMCVCWEHMQVGQEEMTTIPPSVDIHMHEETNGLVDALRCFGSQCEDHISVKVIQEIPQQNYTTG